MENITLENITYALRFLSVLFLTLVIAVYYLLLLLLKAVHEANIFFHNAVPVLVACVEGVTKAFGGLLILINGMWNSKRKLPPIPYENKHQPFAIRYQRNEMMMNSPSFRAYVQSRSITYGAHVPSVSPNSTYVTSKTSFYKRRDLEKRPPITTYL